MDIFRFFFHQARGMLLAFAILLIPFVPAFYYTTLNVETAMLLGRVRALENRKDELEKKNRALRRALLNPNFRLGPAATTASERRTWAGRLLLESQVVRIRIASPSHRP